MSAIGKGLIHPLTALKMRKEGLTDIVWPESLANSEAHSDLLFWCLDVWYWIHDIIVNGWYSTILIGDFFILFGRMCRGFRNKFLNFRGEDGGSTCLRWPGGKLWNMEGSMSFRPQHGVKRGFFFLDFPKADSIDGRLKLSISGMASTSHLASPKFIQSPRSINWQNFRCVLIMVIKHRI